MSKLTEKQKAFCDFYIESLNATESAIKAGYSEKTAKEVGYENLTKPHLKKYIDERMASKENDRIASQDEILQILTNIARGITEEEVVSFTNLGEECRTTRKPTTKDRIKASELLGKRYRMFTDKVDIEVVEPITIIDDIGEEYE